MTNIGPHGGYSEFGNLAINSRVPRSIAMSAKERRVDLIALGVRQARALVAHVERISTYRIVTKGSVRVLTVPAIRLSKH